MIAFGSELNVQSEMFAWYSATAPILAPWCMVAEFIVPGMVDQIISTSITPQAITAGIAADESVDYSLASNQTITAGIVADQSIFATMTHQAVMGGIDADQTVLPTMTPQTIMADISAEQTVMAGINAVQSITPGMVAEQIECEC